MFDFMVYCDEKQLERWHAQPRSTLNEQEKPGSQRQFEPMVSEHGVMGRKTWQETTGGHEEWRLTEYAV